MRTSLLLAVPLLLLATVLPPSAGTARAEDETGLVDQDEDLDRDPFVEALAGTPDPDWREHCRTIRRFPPGYEMPGDTAGLPRLPDSGPNSIPSADDGSGANDAAPPRFEPLAPFIPSDVAAVFFDDVGSAVDSVAGASRLLEAWLPGLTAPGPWGDGEPLRRAIERLGLPPVWRTNPGVRTGLRRIAVLVDDLDLSGGAAIALIGRIDDLSLLLGHRRSGFRWEDARRERFRLDGLDAFTDDGTIRSFFAVEGGLAIFATGRNLRDRIVATARGEAPSHLDAGEGSFREAMETFPRVRGDALLVIPDGFLRAVMEPDRVFRRMGARTCRLLRLRVDGLSLRGGGAAGESVVCPSGGVIAGRSGRTGAWCPVHGGARGPVPLSDLPARSPVEDPVVAEYIARVLRNEAASTMELRPLPHAARWLPGAASEDPGTLDVLLPGDEGRFAAPWWLACGRTPRRDPVTGLHPAAAPRLAALRSLGLKEEALAAAWEHLTGCRLPDPVHVPAPPLALGMERIRRGERWILRVHTAPSPAPAPRGR